MKTLLVNPDLGYLTATPWGILSIGSYLRSVKGYEFGFIDGNVNGKETTFRQIRQQLPQTNLIGISCFSSDAPFVDDLCRMIKDENPKCKVIIGGPHAMLCPEQTIRYENVDYLAYADGEETFSGLMEELSAAKPDFERIPGLMYIDPKSDAIRRTACPEPVPFYDTDYTLVG
jgi:anaerobic magnesium-protoporphyrin IX monomethyl ester cyclase